MFTEEEKIRAIELYFKYGKKLAPVVRELGYPSKRNLRRWIRSWEAGGGAKESIRHKHRYSDEQKQVAVEHYLNHGCCLAFTSRALGYPCTDVLARWVNELYPDRRRIFTSKANPVAPFEPEVKRQAVMALCTRQVSASEIARRIGVSRAVLYKWKDKIIGNSAYQTMRKHNEPSLEAERRCVAGGSRPTESGNTPPADGAGYSEKGGGNHKKRPGHQYQSPEQQRENEDR